MIEFETKISLNAETIESPNIADRFTTEELQSIGRVVKEGYDIDEQSRAVWTKRTEAAFNLAIQLQEGKTFPWQGASNVKFPLVTIAAVQWHSRAYPTLVQGPNIVRCRTNGQDQSGNLRQAADRISDYMSYQLLEDSPTWEEETDRALIQVPIVGCAFKKTYYSPAQGRNCSDLVSAKQFVINYFAKSIETAQRKTHVYPMYRNDIYERAISGVFREDVLEEEWYTGMPANKQDMPQVKSDRRTGQDQPSKQDFTTPFQMLEQHVRMDLDQDGYAEPYIILIEKESMAVCRIVCNFDEPSIKWKDEKWGRVIRIEEDQYFTKIPFIPSPDGGFYDIGFGVLLGPLNDSVNSIINQLIDAGTLATTAGGFLGRGVKIRGGEYSFRPFGWQRVDSTGEDLSKGIFPFPVREPSSTLFNLLSLLIDYTNRISGSTDIMVGENPGQNTPAQTSQLMAEQGAKINNAIFKRVWRSFKEEFQKLYRLNRKYTPVTGMKYGEKNGWISRGDFQLPEEAVRPAADPNLVSDGHRVQQAMTVKQQSMNTPGYNRDAVEKNLLHALKVEDVGQIFPGVQVTGPLPNPKVELEKMKLRAKQMSSASSDQAKLKSKVLELMSKQELNLAQIDKLKAEASAILASVGEAQAAHELKIFEARIGAAEKVDSSYREYIKILMEGKENAMQQGSSPGMAQQPGNPGVQAGAGG